MSAKMDFSRPRFTSPIAALVVLAVCTLGVPTAAATPELVSGSPGALGAAASVTPTLLSAAADGADPEVVELDLVGIDAQAQDELESIAQTQPAPPTTADPETAPALTTHDALGVLEDAASPDVLTEKLGLEPFSVMGVTWDLDPALTGVVVQYRVFQAGAWSEWAWVAPSEPYLDVNTSAPTRGATDAIFVPDSTGVQVLVSSTGGQATAVKIVLIDPGAGPDGSGASKGSGDPADAVDPSATSTPDSETQSTTPSPDPSVTPVPESTPAPTQAPAPTLTPVPLPTPSDGASTGPSPTIDPGDDSGDLGSGPATQTSVAQQPSARAFTAISSSVTALASPLRAATTAKPRIVNRAEWGASQPVCAADRASSTLSAAVHHTASTNTYTAAQVPGLLRGFAEYHMRPEAQGGRGWCDLGYNFLVDKFGTIYEGRAASIDEQVVGVHTGGFNSRTVGVAAIGNYQDAVPPVALAEGVSQIIAWKFAQNRVLANSSVTMISGGGASKFPEGTAVTFNTIYGHRDAQFTTCPGQYLFGVLGDIRNRVATLANQTVAESPYGSWDVLLGGGSSLRVAGWAADPDGGSPVQVQVIVDGSVATTVPASNSRSDVGPRGFDITVPASVGGHLICLRMLNQGGGSDVHLGCRSATSTASSPRGVLDEVMLTDSTLRVRGWARDPDTASPITVHVYIDGRAVAAVPAHLARPDVQATAPGQAGPNHGFDWTAAVDGGRHSVCVYGINVGGGDNALIGCRDVEVRNLAPIGSLDAVVAIGPSAVRVQGWVLDPDTSSSISTHVYVDGRLVTGLLAAGDRPDVERVYGRGAAHGFTTDVAVSAGTHEVCIYAIDSAKGGNPRIGCATVTVVNHTPRGVLDAVSGGAGEVSVRGWTFDSDTSEPISVHVYVDGRLAGPLRADGSRPDVAQAFGTGGSHGFAGSFSVPAGRASVCVYAINTPVGDNPPLGCSPVVTR